jgi:hypothetical protein
VKWPAKMRPLLGVSLSLLQVPVFVLESELHPFYLYSFLFVVLGRILTYTLLQVESTDSVNSRNSQADVIERSFDEIRI